MIWPFKKHPDLRFVATFSRADIAAPVRAARDVKAEWLKKQYDERSVKLARCPGMWDYLQGGYIVPAWCDIHIKANKHGVSIRMDGANHEERFNPQPMDYSLVEGMAPIKDSVKPGVVKIPVPYAVIAKAGISAWVLPATMHSTFLDKLFVYPGMVDYDKFHTINFIFSVTEECEFTIWAGEPLLQVLPVQRRTFTAECGAATRREMAVGCNSFISRRPGAYRRFCYATKKYIMKIRDKE